MAECTCCTNGAFVEGLNPNLCNNCFHLKSLHSIVVSFFKFWNRISF